MDWVTDCFPLSHYQGYRLTGFSLEFLAETHWGDEIEVRIGNAGENSGVEALDKSSATILFKAVLNWDTILMKP